MRLFRQSQYLSTSMSLILLSLLMVLSDYGMWITSMLPASFTKFVSSRNLKVLVLLVCFNKGTAPSSAEEGSGDELTFFGGLPLPLCEGIFTDEQELLKPEGNVEKNSSVANKSWLLSASEL